MVKIRHIVTAAAIAFSGAIMVSSCSDGKTYAELLTEENQYVNAFLADQRVVNEIPADTVFECGEDAPYYRMDDDGQIYMQVIDPGTPGNMAESDELLYFRYLRYNLKYYIDGKLTVSAGNVQDLSVNGYSFRYGNYQLTSSYQWGSGIQLPLQYLPVDCVVNIVIKSQYGFTNETADVIPYLFNIRYYRPKI